MEARGGFPTVGILVTAFQFVFSRAADFVRVLALPFLVLLASTFADRFSLPVVVELATALLRVLIGVLMAVTVHRFTLLGRSSVPRFGVLMPRRREWRFFLWVLLGLLSANAFILLVTEGARPVGQFSVAAGLAIAFAAVLPLMYVFARMSLVLPATALNRRASLRWSWAMTEGNGWRVASLVIIVPALVHLPFLFAAVWVANSWAGGFTVRLAYEALTIPLVVAQIVLLSLVYRELEWGACESN